MLLQSLTWRCAIARPLLCLFALRNLLFRLVSNDAQDALYLGVSGDVRMVFRQEQACVPSSFS